MTKLRAIVSGHIRTFSALLFGLVCYFAFPQAWTGEERGILAWDGGAVCFLVLCVIMFATTREDRMEANACRQQEGEWTLFWLVLAGTIASLGTILHEFSTMKNTAPAVRDIRVATVAATLTLSWLLTHAVFALRYAHEFYSSSDGRTEIDGGLDFPSTERPDYWDFFYFSAVLGMTFQVSDVQIRSRKLRRLATVHGMLGFLFNTVIVALTVNLASGLLS
jgi:uncharacterized membrane protein